MANTRNVWPGLLISIILTVIAFIASLMASINLYLIEDTSRLTGIAYSASPLLRFSYDGIYLSALAASVALCSVIGYALVRRMTIVVISLIIVTILIALGGFGGLLVRQPTTFFVFFIIFLALTLISFLAGRGVAIHAIHASRPLGQRAAAVLGACVSVGCLLLVNVMALVLHTLLLNMVSHALYMQGQIGGTHLNFSLIAMGIAFLALIACIISLAFAFRFPSYQE